MTSPTADSRESYPPSRALPTPFAKPTALCDILLASNSTIYKPILTSSATSPTPTRTTRFSKTSSNNSPHGADKPRTPLLDPANLERLTAEMNSIDSKKAAKEHEWGYPDYFFSKKSETTEPKPKPPKDERLSRETPEGTLRIFMLGVLLGNEQLVKATIVPVSDEDFAYLVKKTKNLRETPKQLKEECAKMKVRALKPGDVVTLPGGDKVTVTEEEVTDDRMVLVIADSPIPTRLYKAKGFWWVDAAPVIAGRKAAEKHDQQEAKTP